MTSLEQDGMVQPSRSGFAVEEGNPPDSCRDAIANGKQPQDLPVKQGSGAACPNRLAAVAQKLVRPTPPEARIDVAFIILAAVMYGAMYFSMGSAFLPGHAAWATLLLWVAAQIGAAVAWQLRLPRVVGMLCAGILMRNIPWSAVDAFPSRWGTQMRAGALATIFLRCGLELDFGTMRRFKYPAMRLALLPGLAEALFAGGLGVAIFGMPVLLAFTMGFILKAVGPGLVVPAMFQLQRTGLGRDQGIPSTVVIAASFDDIIAITGYSIFSSVAITGQGDVAWQIASGPTQVVFGILGGLLAGLALGCTRLFNSRNKRLVGIYGSALLLMFFLEYYHLLSGGALGALFVGLVASNAWEKGVPKFGSLGKSFVFSPEIERVVAVFWQWVWEPMLFVTIGSSIDFDTLDGGIVPRSLIIICSGGCLRILTTLVAMSGFGYTWRERVFYAVAWTPKATVQAALSASPLALINEYKKDAPDYEQWKKWGDEVLVTGIFTIVVCGTLGTLAIHLAAPHLLEPAQASSDEEGEEGGSGAGQQQQELQGGEGEGEAPLAGGQEQAAVAVPAHGVAAAKRSGSGGLLPESDSGSQLQPQPQPQTYQLARRVASANALPGEQEALSDHVLLAEWMDAIRLLTAAVHDERKDRGDLQRLSDHVLKVQKRLQSEMGEREPSVRELFRTATNLAQTFLMRPPGGHHHGGVGRSYSSGGGGMHRRSQDFGGSAGGGGAGSSKAGSRPLTPEDMA